jgi:hypothetical protein
VLFASSSAARWPAFVRRSALQFTAAAQDHSSVGQGAKMRAPIAHSPARFLTYTADEEPLAHEINFEIPQRDRGKVDIEFTISSGGSRLCRLKISKGVDYYPCNAKKPIKRNWV